MDDDFIHNKFPDMMMYLNLQVLVTFHSDFMTNWSHVPINTNTLLACYFLTNKPSAPGFTLRVQHQPVDVHWFTPCSPSCFIIGWCHWYKRNILDYSRKHNSYIKINKILTLWQFLCWSCVGILGKVFIYLPFSCFTRYLTILPYYDSSQQYVWQAQGHVVSVFLISTSSLMVCTVFISGKFCSESVLSNRKKHNQQNELDKYTCTLYFISDYQIR